MDVSQVSPLPILVSSLPRVKLNQVAGPGCRNVNDSEETAGGVHRVQVVVLHVLIPHEGWVVS
jgi:hypothetical protein